MRHLLPSSAPPQCSRKSVRGFTLIELLIVVAIIAVLSSIVLIGLGPTQRAGRDARRIADVRQVQTALELYFNKCGYYPGDQAPGSTCPPNYVVINGTNAWQQLKANLIGSNIGVNQIPNDPSGKNYFYGADQADGSSYVLGATLEDPNNRVFQDSPTGGINGVTCGTPVYCVQL